LWIRRRAKSDQRLSGDEFGACVEDIEETRVDEQDSYGEEQKTQRAVKNEEEEEEVEDDENELEEDDEDLDDEDFVFLTKEAEEQYGETSQEDEEEEDEYAEDERFRKKREVTFLDKLRMINTNSNFRR
jgi:hypothetical protein